MKDRKEDHSVHRASHSESGENDLKRGNINFDLLKPEQPVGRLHVRLEKKLEEEPGHESRRGIFEIKGRTKSIGLLHLIIWSTVFFISCAGLVSILFLAHSVLWILSIPPVLIAIFWSAMMLILYKIRPR